MKLDNGHGKIIQDPDLADIIYHVFRCSQAHASELPVKFKLIPTEAGVYKWRIDRSEDGGVQMPDKIIWALLATAIFSAVNGDINTMGEHRLTWGNEFEGIGTKIFLLRDYWGKEGEVRQFLSTQPQNRTKLEGL